jgi:hypothetical protein
VRRKTTSRSSRHDWKESNVFFIDLMATWIETNENPRPERATSHTGATYHCSAASDIGAGSPHAGKHDITKAPVADLLQNLKSILKGQVVAGR